MGVLEQIINAVKEDVAFYTTLIVLVVTIFFGDYLLDTQPQSAVLYLIIIPILGLFGLLLHLRYSEKRIDEGEYAEIDDNGEVVV